MKLSLCHSDAAPLMMHATPKVTMLASATEANQEDFLLPEPKEFARPLMGCSFALRPSLKAILPVKLAAELIKRLFGQLISGLRQSKAVSNHKMLVVCDEMWS